MNLAKWLRARFRRQRETVLLSQLRIPKEWVGELIEVEFLDHVQNGPGGVAPLFARGRLAEINPDNICIFAWEDARGDQVEMANTEIIFWIVRSTITAITRLERKERKQRYEN